MKLPQSSSVNSKEKNTAMNKRKRLNRILISIAILCPLLYYVGCIMYFLPKDNNSALITYSRSYIGVLLIMYAAPVGCSVVLVIAFINRKKLKLLCWLGLLLLLLFNLYHIYPVHEYVDQLFSLLRGSLNY